MGALDTLIYGYRTILNAGSALLLRSKLNFSSAFTVTDNPSTGCTDVDVSVAGGGGYTTVDANGTPVTQRTTMNFSSDFAVADVGGKTHVALVATGGTPTAASLDGTVARLPRVSTQTSTAAYCPHKAGMTVRMDGDPNTVYSVTLRIRGVGEGKVYNGGTLISTGVNHGVARITHGGAAATGVTNMYKIEVEDPSDYWWLNTHDAGDGATSPGIIDQNITISIRGGSHVRLAAFADYEDTALITDCTAQGTEYRNDAGSGNTPASLPDTTGLASDVASQPYDGQFFQVDVVSVS